MTQTIKRIGVVSDTHADSGRALTAELLEGLSGVDLILHAGDITADSFGCFRASFNPGSAAQPRFTDTPSFGILTLGEAIESAVMRLP